MPEMRGMLGHRIHAGPTLILGSHPISPSPCTQGEGWGGGSFRNQPRMCVRPSPDYSATEVTESTENDVRQKIAPKKRMTFCRRTLSGATLMIPLCPL